MNAPIALFVYKRPDHLKRVYNSLQHCPEFHASELFVFADGAKGQADAAGVAAVRELVRFCSHPKLRLVAQERNIGLSQSITRGVSALCRSHGRVIVVEDDLEVAPAFLGYMNQALDRYAEAPRVMHVSGYVYGTQPLNRTGEAVLLPFTHPWGWATWERAWQMYDAHGTGWREVLADRDARRRFNLNAVEDFAGMLELQMTGRCDSWWIRWYLTVFRCWGLGLFPPTSAVDNNGFDRHATHGVLTARLLKPRHRSLLDRVPLLPDVEDASPEDMLEFTRGMRPTLRRALRLIGKLRRGSARFPVPGPPHHATAPGAMHDVAHIASPSNRRTAAPMARPGAEAKRTA